jgi:hypothetical protein
MQRMVRAATLPNAVRAVGEVWLVDRFQQHRSRSLDQLLLKGRLADRTLSPIVLFEPDALYWGRLVAPAAQALVQVAQILVEVFGVFLRRHPIDPRGTGLARVAVRLPQKVYINQVRQRRKDAVGIAGGLRRNPLEFWCDGW